MKYSSYERMKYSVEVSLHRRRRRRHLERSKINLLEAEVKGLLVLSLRVLDDTLVLCLVFLQGIAYYYSIRFLMHYCATATKLLLLEGEGTVYGQVTRILDSLSSRFISCLSPAHFISSYVPSGGQ